MFSSLGALRFNESGMTAFTGGLTGPDVTSSNNLGIWAESQGSVKLVFRKGDPAPGTDSGIVFGLYEGWFLNGVGQIAFGASLSGPGVDASNSSGLWMGTIGEVPELLLRTGDLLDVNNDSSVEDLRTISNIILSGFNNAGQIALLLHFVDNSQAMVVASTGETPEAPLLSIVASTPGEATISWNPNSPGLVLQETLSLHPTNWMNSPSGSTNPITVPSTGDTRFYRLFKP